MQDNWKLPPLPNLKVADPVAFHGIVIEGVSKNFGPKMVLDQTDLLIHKGETLVIGHVGDCRAFMALGGELIQLTQDHSMENDYAREGLPLPPEMESMASILTRWLGQAGDVDVEMSQLMEFKRHNTLVICSDGLTKTVTPDEVLHTVSMHLSESACRKLVELAKERGGPDNITVQVARLR